MTAAGLRRGRKQASRLKKQQRQQRQGLWLRIFYYAIMALCLFGGLANAVKAYYYVFFTQLFVVIVSVLLNLWTYFSFSYTQVAEVQQAVKGENVHLKVGIFNDKPFAFTLMRVHVQGVSLSQQIDLKFNLAPRSDIAFDIPLELPYRGEFQVGMTYLHVQDIFGLFPMRFDMRRLPYYKMLRLRVYPRLHKLPVLRTGAQDEKHFNALNLMAAQQGDSYAFVRTYQGGDTASRIHWKLSMRDQELLTRQYDIPTQARTLIVMDACAHPLGAEEALYYADTLSECAVALAHHSLAASHPVQIAATGVPGAQGVSLQEFPKLYEYLALLPFSSAESVGVALSPYVLSGEAPHSIFVLANRVDEGLRGALSQASERGRQVTLLLVDTPESDEKAALPQGVLCHEITTGQDIAKALEAVL